MAGHSKWDNIKHTKMVQDSRKGSVFTKLARVITVAVKVGGGADIDTNFKLRVAIQKARDASVPNENIERAIQKGLGGGAEESLESFLYEGFTEDGIGILAQGVTDNKNRTMQEVKIAMRDYDTSLGAIGSVSHLFKYCGQFLVKGDIDENSQLEIIDSGAEEIIYEDGETYISCPAKKYSSVHLILEKLKINIINSELAYIPNLKLETKDREKIDKLVESLEDLDDVQNVYHNAN